VTGHHISVRKMNRMFAAAKAAGERPFATIERYWNDPDYAADLDAEQAVEQAKLNARLDESARLVRERREQSQQNAA
jgi:hypothetical protein